MKRNSVFRVWLPLVNYVFGAASMKYHNKKTMDLESIGVAGGWCLGDRVAMVECKSLVISCQAILGYILPRQAPVHNPYYSALLSYACALSF